MATGLEHETESVRSCSTDASMLRLRCKTLQVSVNSVSGAFSVVQDTFEKLVKETSMLLNEAGSPQFGTCEKACLRQEENRLRNTLVLMTNNLSALSRCLKEHRQGIDKAVDDQGIFITTKPLQIHSPLSPLSENTDYLSDYNDRRGKKRKFLEITEDPENIISTKTEKDPILTPAKKQHLNNWINKLPDNESPSEGIFDYSMVRKVNSPMYSFTNQGNTEDRDIENQSFVNPPSGYRVLRLLNRKRVDRKEARESRMHPFITQGREVNDQDVFDEYKRPRPRPPTEDREVNDQVDFDEYKKPRPLTGYRVFRLLNRKRVDRKEARESRMHPFITQGREVNDQEVFDEYKRPRPRPPTEDREVNDQVDFDEYKKPRPLTGIRRCMSFDAGKQSRLNSLVFGGRRMAMLLGLSTCTG